jgi:hypothetical protein
MSLQFHQAVENMDVWSASSAEISFVITFASPAGPGFHGCRGFLASWRPLYSNKGAVEISGSPFSTLADAEKACNTMLGELEGPKKPGSTAQANKAAPLSLNTPRPSASAALKKSVLTPERTFSTQSATTGLVRHKR